MALLLLAAACGRQDDAPATAQPVREQSNATSESDATETQPTAPAEAAALANQTATPIGVEHDYVGTERCATCHPRQTERWLGSDHDLAMHAADGSLVLGDFDDATFTRKGVTSSFHYRDGKYVIRTQGPDGELADFEVEYTFGVEPLQQYLLRLPGGRLQAFGVAWDSRPRAAGGQRWFSLFPNEDLAPGDALHWTGPDQTWNFMCAECHSTGLRRGFDAATATYETTFEEVNVACESCHGPGSMHVAWAESPRESAAPKGLPADLRAVAAGRWVLAPGAKIAHREPSLTSHVEVELCARCHARRAELSENYVVGQPLTATHRPALLAPGLYHPDGQILEEVYVYGSFLQSRMYAAGVTCSDCHDAHSLAIHGNPDDVCSRCHLTSAYATPAHHHHGPDSAGASCVACHMPTKTYMVVDPRRDHSFRVPRPDLTARIGVPNACGDCHRAQSPAWAAEQVAAWYPQGRTGKSHYGDALWAARQEQPGARQALLAVAADRSQPAIVRASAVEALGAYAGPDSAHIIAQAATDEDPLLRMAAVEAARTLPPAPLWQVLAPLLSDPLLAVRVAAGRAAASVPVPDPGATGATTGAPHAESPLLAAKTRALEEWIATQQLNADRSEAMTNVGGLYGELGAFEAAEKAYRTAIERDRTFLPAYVNLADLYRAAGREADCERLLGEALAVDPDAAAVHHALGLLRVRQRRNDDAMVELARAAELAPNDPQYAYVYAVALHSMERSGDAIDVLEAALAPRPANVQLLQALATILRDGDQRDEALRYARRLTAAAPYDPSTQALVRQLEASP